jgi:hypothetical protein
MALPAALVSQLSWLAAIPLGALVYGAALLALRTLDQKEMALLEPLVGARAAAMLRRVG